MVVEKDELTGLDKTNDPVTEPEVKETPEQELERLKTENKNLKDGSSRLGREFKSFKEEQSGKYDEILEKMAQITTSPQKEPDTIGGYEDEEDKRARTIAREEAKKERLEAESEFTTAKEKYVKDYTKTIQALGRDEDVEVYEAITEEMKGLPGYSNDGVVDAERNYEKAERNYYKKLTGKTKTASAFKGGDPKGTKVGGSSTVETKDTTDEDVASAMKNTHVQQYLSRRKSGKTEAEIKEFVSKAIKHKTPTSGTMRI